MQPTSGRRLHEEERDPFPYGWRDVEVQTADGRIDFERQPLTLEDVLHPREGDVIPQSGFHEWNCGYLVAVFRTRLSDRGIALVTGDRLIDWGVEGVRDTSPDVGVFADFEREPDQSRGTLVPSEAGGKCLLVVEVVSPNTRSNDVERKVELYHKVGIPLYVLLDKMDEEDPYQLVGYRWSPEGYEQVSPDSENRLLLEDLNLYLRIDGQRVVCIDVTTGEELGDYTAVREQMEQLQKQLEEVERIITERDRSLRAAEEALRERDQANERVRELEALLARLQGPAAP